MSHVRNVRNEFLLQKNFLRQAKHEEAKLEYRLNEEMVRVEDAKIKKCLVYQGSVPCMNNNLLLAM